MSWDWVDDVVLPLAIVVGALVLARVVDRLVVRHLGDAPGALTRYRVLRRGIRVAIVTIGVLSALVVIPQVRVAAGVVLGSSAVIALIVGYAAQPTLSNFIAGILIAFMQPLRIGDHVEASGAVGTVEDIGLTYTRIRSPDGARFYLPNSKLASDTIRNATLAGAEHLARVSISVPSSADADWVMKMLVEEARKAPGTLPERTPVATVAAVGPGFVETAVEAWSRTDGQAANAARWIRAAALRRINEHEASLA
jgi:small conductance mechanosensitive channel